LVIVMAEVQLRQSDASRWRIHYLQWRDRFGIGSLYVKNLQDVIILAVKSDGLAVEKKEQLAALIREIDAERGACATSGERIDPVTTAIDTQDR
jgi:hypothetical protein